MGVFKELKGFSKSADVRYSVRTESRVRWVNRSNFEKTSWNNFPGDYWPLILESSRNMKQAMCSKFIYLMDTLTRFDSSFSVFTTVFFITYILVLIQERINISFILCTSTRQAKHSDISFYLKTRLHFVFSKNQSFNKMSLNCGLK